MLSCSIMAWFTQCCDIECVFVKYPPYSWLRLSDAIKKSPSKIWFTFNKLPSKQESCRVKIHVGNILASVTDPFSLLEKNNSLILPREQKILELFLKIAKPTKMRSDFILDHGAFCSLLPYCSVIPFEIDRQGVLSFAKQNAQIVAKLDSSGDGDASIGFSLETEGQQAIENPIFFGDINTYVIDQGLKIYPVSPKLTQAEAEAILSSPPLPLLGLCQRESRQMFYALAKLGIDFSCLKSQAYAPDRCQIFLRLLLTLDEENKRVCARAHLVTQINHGDFSDEVEIKSTGHIPVIHIRANHDLDEEKFVEKISAPDLLIRPQSDERAARNFLYQLGASPARLHDGFELMGEHAINLLKVISSKNLLPDYLKLDDHARPKIIEIDSPPTLKIKAVESNPKRVDVALSISPEFDETGADFSILSQAIDNILVLDEDNLLVLHQDPLTTVRYFAETLNLERPEQFRNKSVAQIALLLNSLGDRIRVSAPLELMGFLKDFAIRTEASDRTLPKTLKTTLRQYQIDAVAWLAALHRSGLGGLLGDEMGLGKTIMVLTHLSRLKEMGQLHKPALVICPTSVMDVWYEEANKHISDLRIIKWHGPDRDQLDEKSKQVDIVITSYAILRRDFEDKLKNMEFSTLVLDEAQFIRNQQTDSFKAAKALNCQHRIALTGTPIENHLKDLYSILDCVEDGILGRRSSFEKQFSNSMDNGQLNDTAGLKMLLSPIVTRRRKSEVESELPPKIESLVHCKLSQHQLSLYYNYVMKMKGSIITEDNELSAAINGPNHFSLLSALTRLRQICCHPSLVLGEEADTQCSGKLAMLRQTIQECLEMGRKIIVYSQFLKMQALIVKIAEDLHPDGALWLHGSTTNRDEIVKSFQSPSGPRIIVVSLKAGGTGITLTEADTVIFADPWWNPAVEDQAIDRAHRIGQKKTVHVIRLIAENSIEQEVVALAHKKRIAAHSILNEGFKSTSNLSKDEVKNLLLHEIKRIDEKTA